LNKRDNQRNLIQSKALKINLQSKYKYHVNQWIVILLYKLKIDFVYLKNIVSNIYLNVFEQRQLLSSRIGSHLKFWW
jgi:hypothetical protein